MVENCKQFFDEAIKKLYDPQSADTNFLEDKKELLEDLISGEEDIDDINEKL